MDIKKVFNAISQRMLIDFENMSSQINHPGEKGKAREVALSEFLKEYLPNRYSVSSGEIIDIVLQKSFFHRPDSAVTAKPSAKQSPRRSGDCFGKNALAMTMPRD